MKTILIIAAHSDDQIIGCGGAAAKYASDGYDVKTIVVTKGEVSHPHFQEDIIIGTREKESMRADKIIGGHGVKFLEILEKDMNNEKEFLKATNKLASTIEKLNPEKIFVHAADDPHPIHRRVHKMALDSLEMIKTKVEVYSFDIWNLFKWDKKKPHLVVDISEHMSTKIKALKVFKSQFNLIGFLNYFALTGMYFRNLVHGKKHGVKFAEIFYRIK